MKTYQIVLLPGDGIGPEITSITKNLLEIISRKFGFQLNFDEKLIGGRAIESMNSPLPEETLESCKSSDAVLLAAIGDTKYDNLPRDKRPETGLLSLREGLKLFANIRPVKTIPSLIDASSLKPNIIKDVDLIVVRELTGGIYFGKPKGRVKLEKEERAFNTMTYSSQEIISIAEIAFNLAQGRRNKLCSVDKANVLDVSQLWREKVEETSNRYPNVDTNHMYVDNASMQLIREPSQFDVILTGNLFGDILSDEAAMLTGSIGMLPSASLSKTGPGLFEPVHGSAPDIAGLDKANPLAMALSAAMMLRIGLKEEEAALALEASIEKVLEQGFRTSDIAAKYSEIIGCKQMGDQLIEVISNL